jgi:hypothetical protein
MKGGTAHKFLATNSARSRLTNGQRNSKKSDEACSPWMNSSKRSRISPWFDGETFRNHFLIPRRRLTIKTSQGETYGITVVFYGTARLTACLDQ